MNISQILLYNDRSLAIKLALAAKEDKCKQKFYLDKFSDKDCQSLFRFTGQEIKTLRRLFLIPDQIRIGGYSCGGTEGLCILLRRLAYPNRLGDLTLFNRSKSSISRIFNYVLSHIIDQFGYLLDDMDQPWLSPDSLRLYADAVMLKGAPLPGCWGFIDGTVRPICRPGRLQKDVFNGHKRVHALKYQSIVAPNGLIANLYGPVEGRRHDAYLLSESGILQQLEAKNIGGGDTPLCVYGDPAYPIRTVLQGPFKRNRLLPLQSQFNKKMSSVRISVEWVFGKIVSLWAFVDFKKNQRLFHQPVGKHFKCAALLTNVHTCLNGNQVSETFNLLPPSVEEYLIPRI